MKVAGFPFLRTIDEYDFSFQPTVDESKVKAIIDSNFYEEAINVVFVGNPGVGKTHLAIAIGYSVAIQRNSVYFIKFNKLITHLKMLIMKEFLINGLNIFINTSYWLLMR